MQTETPKKTRQGPSRLKIALMVFSYIECHLCVDPGERKVLNNHAQQSHPDRTQCGYLLSHCLEGYHCDLVATRETTWPKMFSTHIIKPINNSQQLKLPNILIARKNTYAHEIHHVSS